MRVRLRALGRPRRAGPHVPLRRAQAAAVLLAAVGRRRSRGRCSSRRCGMVAIAARRANAGTDAATLRDLASEIEWAKATLASPETYLAAVAKHRRDTPARGRDGGQGLRRLRVGQAARRSSWTSTTCCCTPARSWRTTRRSPASSARVTGVSWSTSTRTSPRCSSARSTPGSAAATSSPWSATPIRRSTPSPAPRPGYLLGFDRQLPERDRRPAGARLPLDARRWSPWPTG